MSHRGQINFSTPVRAFYKQLANEEHALDMQEVVTKSNYYYCWVKLLAHFQ